MTHLQKHTDNDGDGYIASIISVLPLVDEAIEKADKETVLKVLKECVKFTREMLDHLLHSEYRKIYVEKLDGLEKVMAQVSEDNDMDKLREHILKAGEQFFAELDSAN